MFLLDWVHLIIQISHFLLKPLYLSLIGVLFCSEEFDFLIKLLDCLKVEIRPGIFRRSYVSNAASSLCLGSFYAVSALIEESSLADDHGRASGVDLLGHLINILLQIVYLVLSQLKIILVELYLFFLVLCVVFSLPTLILLSFNFLFELDSLSNEADHLLLLFLEHFPQSHILLLVGVELTFKILHRIVIAHYAFWFCYPATHRFHVYI